MIAVVFNPPGAPQAVIVRLVVLPAPVTGGLLLTTRILNPVPEPELDGRTAGIVPELAVLESVPIFLGLLNPPVEFDNWAV